MLVLKDSIRVIKYYCFKLITGRWDAERGKLGSRMSVLSKRSLGSAQMKPLSREKDDCKSKTCKVLNIIVLLLQI